ncbi:MAG: VCBS repeat-containing protein [Methanomassiliicoccus sp.]|nr:VCBS repeat-containing protein [Methanomassiliicoccus sp.]
MTTRISVKPEGRQAGRPGSKSGRSVSTGGLRKRRTWSRYGVSDIIGNLLILAITVTLFTGVLYFVSSMPGPQEKVYTDFSSSVKLMNNAGNDAYINITHKGGESLIDHRTNIYLFKNNTPIPLKIADGGVTGGSWPTGVTWSYVLSGVLTTTDLSVMIVDSEANTVVYTAPLQGGDQSAMTNPIIADRGLTPTPAYDGNKVRFYTQISDPYGKLDKGSVILDASALGMSSTMPLVYNATLNLFVSQYYTASVNWNGMTVLIHAADTSGHRSMASMSVSVLPASSSNNGPYSNYPTYLTDGTYPPDASGGEAGGSLGITFYYIRKTADWSIARNFNVSEGVTIEVWSDTLLNVAGQNSLYVYHPLLGVTPLEPQSSNTAFQIGSTFSTFRQFLYNFTAPADGYRYPIQIIMKDNQGNTLNVADYINVNGQQYPQLETYVASGNNLVRTNSFNHTDDVYLVIRTRDVDRYTSTVYMSGIEVDDYSGSYVIMKSPTGVPNAGQPVAYSAPLSSLFKTNGATIAPYGNNTNTGVYTLKITLKDANQGWWLPKTNSYTLKISTFFDSGDGGTYGESYSQLSCQFTVTAPLTTTDVAAALGSGSFSWSSSGAAWENNAISWFKGGDQWNEKIIDSNPSKGPLGLYLADLTGDGRNDLVVGAQDTSLSNLFWYENSKSDGSEWSSARPISYPFDANPGTQTAYSTDKGNANEDASVWSTASYSSDRFYSGYSSNNEMCAALAVADLNNDGRADVVASFIHVVVYTSATSADNANYQNSWGMYFNRGVYVFWNDGSSNWQRTTLYGTDSWIAADAANKDTNPAAGDIAVADFNQDGYKDIVAVYEDGNTKVWLNQWVKSAGSLPGAFSTSNSLRDLPKVNGNLPWVHAQDMPKVRAADMNGDGYPDIVRTSTKSTDLSVYIYYTQKVTAAVPMDDPDFGFAVDSVYGATVADPITRLLAKDSAYQTLTEKDVLYAPYNAVGSKILSGSITDTTGSAIANSWADDGTYYDIGANTRLALNAFQPNLENLTTPIKSSYLVVEYKVDAGYTGTSYIQYSFDGGATWKDTTVLPKNTDTTDKVVRFELTTKGGDKYANLTSNLQVQLFNPAGSSTVHIDYIYVEVTFVKTQAVGWIYQIPNAPAAYQVLTIAGHVSGTEGFKIEYSPDNETWFTLGQITSKTDVTQSYNLTYTPNAYYYVRITDLNRAVTDTVKDVFSLDQLVISHNSPTVQWGSATYIWKSPNDYISGLAVGDMKKRLGVYVPNEPNDIVVTTGGNTASANKLFIIQQVSFGTFTAQSLDTSKMAIMCPASGAYETHGVELGDLDGDQDLDIILIVGAQVGRDPGTGPTLWEYTNNQQFGTTWKFTETPISSVAAKGKSVINVTTGYIDLTILLPMFGMVAIVAASEAMGRYKGRKR